MGAVSCQITSLTIVCSNVYSGVDQRKHQSSASLAFVWRIHRWPVNSPHKWPVTRKNFPFDDVIMTYRFVCDVITDPYNNHHDTDRSGLFHGCPTIMQNSIVAILQNKINKVSFTVGAKFTTRERNDTVIIYIYIFIGIVWHVNTYILKASIDQPYPYKAHAYHYVYR